jgi:hypothetical protein
VHQKLTQSQQATMDGVCGGKGGGRGETHNNQ